MNKEQSFTEECNLILDLLNNHDYDDNEYFDESMFSLSVEDI
ncbi:hypothetical protein NVP1101O_022 [Vibrio phage 1.101.O._10N.261.45.C6]|nr:hypothetical protein NVP1084O_014 [Vibrio phage 1.084.O._10N.261.49.F5]AUR87433.1 hypothetical protein NVP1101O_022 [Vibrio phage 1.101.O._10N.261.45.C6]